MPENNCFSLVNLDGASDVVVKFLDMIQNAIGWVAAPRGAKKDFNEAVEIYKDAIKDSDLSGIEKASKISSARKEIKQYINQSKIIAFAIPELNQDGKLNEDEDWLAYFFNYAQNISDESVQRIWARILAEHCNGDTSIKRMLIHTLSLLDSESAKAFGNLCRITFEYPQQNAYEHFGSKFISKHIPLVIDPMISGLPLTLSKVAPDDARYISAKKYREYIPSPSTLTILQEIGLIELPEKRGEDFEYPYSFGLVHHDYSGKNCSYKGSWIEEYIITYGKDEYVLEPNGINKEDILKADSDKKLPKSIKFGRVKFSTVGETLYKILNLEKLDEFETMFRFYIESQGFSLIKKSSDLNIPT